MRRFAHIACRRILPLAPLLALSLLMAACTEPQSTIDPKSDVAQRVQDLYSLVFWIASVIFALVLAGVVWFSFQFRERSGRAARQIHGNTRLEVVWTIIPVVILIVIAVPTFDTVVAIQGDAPEGAVEVVATGHQWWFEFAYPDLGVTTANEMHVPVGQAVNVKLLSSDVIHSFWVPKLAGKTDMVPGRENRLWFTPQEPGVYLAQCAEFCGLSHANMRFRVIVDTQEDFDAWVESIREGAKEPEGELAQAGQEQFTGAGGCAACHTIQGLTQGRQGPDLTNVGQRETIAAGMLPLTPENLARWLADPPAVKPGAKMPDLNLSDEQIRQLVAFLLSQK